MPLTVESLTRKHNRSDFSCGVEALDYFLKRTAMQHIDNGVSKTFVLLNDVGSTTITGYFTLTICEVLIEQLEKRNRKGLPTRHGLPAGKLARLAVSEQQQGQGFGEQLLVSAMRHFLQAHEHIGMSALFVNAKGKQAASFYERYGFIQSCDDPLYLYLPTSTIKAANL